MSLLLLLQDYPTNQQINKIMIQTLKSLNFREFPVHSVVFVISTLAMIGLGVAGFCVPPVGEIHQSVFQYGCLLCVPLSLSQIKPVLREAKHLHHMKTSIGKVTIETENEVDDPVDSEK